MLGKDKNKGEIPTEVTTVTETQKAPKKKFYKQKWFWIVIAVLLVFSLFGGKGGDKSSTDDNTATIEEQSDDTAKEATEVITLTAGEVGDYGKEIVMNEGTDLAENLIVYYVPSGDYTVKNVGESRTQVSVYEGFSRNEETGYDDYSNVGDTPSIDVNETADITVPEGWFIEIHEPCVVELVAK